MGEGQVFGAFGAFAEDRKSWLCGKREGEEVSKGAQAAAPVRPSWSNFSAGSLPAPAPCPPHLCPQTPPLLMGHSTSQAQTPHTPSHCSNSPCLSSPSYSLRRKRPLLQAQEFSLLEVVGSLPSSRGRASSLLCCFSSRPGKGVACFPGFVAVRGCGDAVSAIFTGEETAFLEASSSNPVGPAPTCNHPVS